MVNFTKIFGLAGATLVFAGLSYGQNASCTTPTAAATLIRAEGTTEQVADLNFSCTEGATAATLNILDILSLPVTSKVLGSANGTSYSEALLVETAPALTYYEGVVNGSQINFSGITLPAGVATVFFTITNVRVNASSVIVTTGTPPVVTESAFISGGVGFAASALASTPVAYALSGLSSVTAYKTLANPQTGASKGTNNFVICAAINSSHQGGGGTGLISVLEVGENFATAFKGVGTAANSTLGSEFANNTETGFVPPGGYVATATTPVAGSNIANSGTQLQIVFSNLPANVSLSLPTSISSDQTPPQNAPVGSTLGTLTLVSSSGAAVSASTTNGFVANTGQVTVSSGTATAYYQFNPGTLSSTTTESFAIPVYAIASSNTITASTTAITAAVSFSPIGTTTVPSFVVGSSTVNQTLSTFSGCTTSLLFPFVTNQSGFDTGIAISNTSTDPFGTKGATPQSGTCSLNFYGAGAPSPNSLTTANVPSGTTYTGILSGLAAGFQGYMIAQCQFQFAHGFAFVTDGVGASGGLSQGYLAGVIPDVNQVSRAASPLSAAGANTGETLGN